MPQYTTIHKPTMLVIGLACRTSNDKDAAPIDIPKLSQKFHADEAQNKIPNKVSDDLIVLYCDYEGDHTKPYTCVIGCPVSSLENVPSGMVGKVIPASTFAAYKAEGEFPKSLIETWGAIWHSDLQRTYTGDYEVYSEQFASGKSTAIDVLVAI